MFRQPYVPSELFQIFYQHSVRSALLWTALCSVSVIPDIPSALCSASFTLDSPMFLQSSVPSTLFLAAIVMFLQSYVPSILFLAARGSFSLMFRQLYSAWTVRYSLIPMSPELDDLNLLTSAMRKGDCSRSICSRSIASRFSANFMC